VAQAIFVKLAASFLQKERERQSGYDTANYTGKVYTACKPLVRAPCALAVTKIIVERGRFRAFFCPTSFWFSS
jgi:hypothetical protein